MKIVPGTAQKVSRVPWRGCFATGWTAWAVWAAAPDDFFAILVALGRYRAPLLPKPGAWPAPNQCKIMTKIHGKIDAEKVLEKGCQNHGKCIQNRCQNRWKIDAIPEPAIPLFLQRV